MMAVENVTSGRPPKFTSNDIVYYDEGYIATNPLSVKLLQEISEMANYRMLTVTGPQQKNSKQKNIKKKDVKTRKEIEKQQGNLRQKLEIKESKVFLLRNQEENPRKYYLMNEELIEINYSNLNLDDVKQQIGEKFASSIQRIFNELNQETQIFLKDLVSIFVQSNKSLEQFQDNFFQQFEKSSNDQYPELKCWNALFELSFDEKRDLIKSESAEYREKYSLNSNGLECKRKVELKRYEVLRNQQKIIQSYFNVTKPNRPLKLLTSRIHTIFLKMLQNEQ